MRQTVGQTEEALEFMAKVESMSQEARDHFKTLIEKLIVCYLDDKAHAVVLIDHDLSDKTAMIAVNANEMEVAALLNIGAIASANFVMADMPDKGMLN